MPNLCFGLIKRATRFSGLKGSSNNKIIMKKENYMQTKVSMVMPVYNKKDEICIMLESIYNQTWNNIELIMVNDGATDGTREILAEWESKFIDRGYTVIIIDQENQGISAAVRNGMLQMTGEYFCSVDCDDYLYPKYVSTMADWLDKNPEYDYVNCSFERVFGTKSNPIINQAEELNSESFSHPNHAESILLCRLPINSWIYMIRKKYAEKYKIIDNFVTEPRLFQEPSIVIPLAMSGGNMKHFPTILYRHFLTERTLHDNRKLFNNFEESFYTVNSKVIESFPLADQKYKNKLQCINELFFIKKLSVYLSCRNVSTEKYYTQLMNIVNQYFTPSPNISIEDIFASRHDPLLHMIANCILKINPPLLKNKYERLYKKRIICYGVLGTYAKQLLPPLFSTELKPDLLWDVNANGQIINNIVVEKPDFTKLNKDDLFIILPKRSYVLEQIMPMLSNARIKSIICYFDLLQYLGECFYPCFANNDCRFTYD